jgi:sulfonate transport system substrate-binding protein
MSLLAGSALAQTAAPALQQLRIGFQKSAVNLVILKQQGLLEKHFANTKVQWLEFPAGSQLLEALSVGALEFGLTGDSPPVFAQAAGKDLPYVGAEPPKPLSSAILVPATSTLRTLADLKSKRVALQKGSSAHFLLVRAVERAGLQWSDITPIYVAPADARAAFEKGAVDAWAIWDPFYAATELSIKPRVLTNGMGPSLPPGRPKEDSSPRGAGAASAATLGPLSNNNSFYLASRPFVEQQGAALQFLLDALTQADAYVQSNRKEAAQLISDFSGLSLATVHLFISRRPRSPVAPLSAALIADQQRVADAFFKLGLIPKAVKVSDIVWQPGKGRAVAAV